MRAAHHVGDGLGRFIFRYVVGFQAHRHHGRLPGGAQRGDIRGGEAAALAKRYAAGLDAMGEQRAFGRRRFHLGKYHAPRRTAVIWARTETAISAGESAPMERPTGPWMRATSVGVKPAVARRSSRAPWVFRLPRAPM